MFTGIVEEVGQVISLTKTVTIQNDDGVEKEGWVLLIEAKEVLSDAKLGDSIAVNGTCLTYISFDSTTFSVGISPETLRCTNLGDLKAGDPVNLERSVTGQGRMGGHFVQGHVDGTGTISEFRPDGDSLFVTIKADPSLVKYIVRKGYICIDGTSLTVVDVGQDWFNFMLIAWTQQRIGLPSKKVGDRINIEVDILAKYVEKFIMQGAGSPYLEAFLSKQSK